MGLFVLLCSSKRLANHNRVFQGQSLDGRVSPATLEPPRHVLVLRARHAFRQCPDGEQALSECSNPELNSLI